jgi:hypothetical protein
MATATNPETGEKLVLSGDKWLPVEQTATDQSGRKAYLAAGQWVTEESVNEPTSVQSAVAARNDLPPTVQDRYSQRYNPQQSVGGYVANEAGKAAMGILGMPDLVLRQEAAGGLPTPLSAVSNIAMKAREALGIPSLDRISQILGIEPNMKAPGPGTKFLTGAGIDVAQNMLIPGGGVAQKIAGGIGSFAGRTAAEGSGPIGELVGSVVGGVAAPALVATRLGALNSVRQVAGGSLEEFSQKLKNNPEVMGRLRTSVINELAESLRKDPDTYATKYAAAQELESAIPGLKLNLGQSFEAPSVLQKQRGLEASSPNEMNAAQARRDANESALRSAMGESPSARGGAESVLSDMSGAASARSRDLAAQIAKVSDEAQALSARVAQRADLPELGQKALDIRASELGKARAKANELMGLATRAASDEGAQFDPTPLVAKAKEVLKQPIWDDANATSIFGKIKGLDGEEVAPVAFEDIRDMRQAVNADIASALRSNSPNARMQLRNLGQLKDEIDRVINDSPFQQTKVAYGTFVDFYKREFAPRFLRGVNLMPEKTTALGETRLPPEKVFTNYFKPNGATEMSRYLKLYGDNSEAMSAMREAMIDRYAKEVMKDGVIDPASHARFMDRYRVPMATLDKAGFKFGAELQDNAKAFESVTDRLASLRDAAERADKDLVRGLISDQFGAKSPEQVMAEILPDPRKTSLLLSRMNQEQARGLVDFMKDDLVRQFSKDGSVSPDAIESFLSDRMKVVSYRNALAKAYSTDVADAQIKTLGSIAEAAKRLDTTPVPRTAAVQGKPTLFHDELQKRTGLSIAVVGNMLRAVVAGRVSPEWAAMALGSQAGATVMQNMKNEIYKEVLKDPQAAQLLLQAMKTAPESTAGAAAVTRFLKRVPSAVSYFVGFNKYPEFAKYATANFARSQSEPQE